MHSRLLFYKFSFIANIIGCIVFSGLVIYNVFTLNAKVSGNDKLGFVLLVTFIMIYLLVDFAGLDLLKKLNNNENLSRKRIIWIGIGLFFQFVIEALLAIGLFYAMRNTLMSRGEFSIKTYVALLTYYGVTFAIFLTGIYNIFAILKLIKKVNVNQVEFEQIIEDMGANR